MHDGPDLLATARTGPSLVAPFSARSGRCYDPEMRSVAVMSFLLAVLPLAACRQVVARRTSKPGTRAERPREVLAEFVAGKDEAGARLAAAGPSSVVLLRPLLLAKDPSLRQRTRSLLLSMGADRGFTDRERVDVSLRDLVRTEPHPFAGLLAVARLRVLKSLARPELVRKAKTKGAEGRAARRLLSRWTP